MGQDPGSASRDTRNNTFELFWKPQQMEDVNYLMKQSSFQRGGHSFISSRTTGHQETIWGQIKGCRPCTHPDPLSATPPLKHCYKTPHQIPLGWDTQFLRHEPTVTPFAWQSSKATLFYFTQKSVSEIPFGTGAQRPSFRHQDVMLESSRQCQNSVKLVGYPVSVSWELENCLVVWKKKHQRLP